MWHLTGAKVTLKKWDAQRYDSSLPKRPTGQNPAEEERMTSRHPVNDDYKDLLIMDPAIIVDRHSKIVAWYVPSALSPPRQVRLI